MRQIALPLYSRAVGTVVCLVSVAFGSCTGALADASGEWTDLLREYARVHHLQAVVAAIPDQAPPADWRQVGAEKAFQRLAGDLLTWRFEQEGVLVWYSPPAATTHPIARTKARYVRARADFLGDLPADLKDALRPGDAIALEQLSPEMQDRALLACAPLASAPTPAQILRRKLLPQEKVAVRPEVRLLAYYYAEKPGANGELLSVPVVLTAEEGELLYYPSPLAFISKPGSALLRQQERAYIGAPFESASTSLSVAALTACPLWADGNLNQWPDRMASAPFPPVSGEVWSAEQAVEKIGQAIGCQVKSDRRLAKRQVFVYLDKANTREFAAWLCNATGAQLRLVEGTPFFCLRPANLVPWCGMKAEDARVASDLHRWGVSRARTMWPSVVGALADLATGRPLLDHERLPDDIRAFLTAVQRAHREKDPKGVYPDIPDRCWVQLMVSVEVQLVALVPTQQGEDTVLWQPDLHWTSFRDYVRYWTIP